MQQGYILGSMYGTLVTTPSKWTPGKPYRVLSFHLLSGDTKSMPITTYRCPKYGYLESYAF
jgi:hypothetical protein